MNKIEYILFLVIMLVTAEGCSNRGSSVPDNQSVSQSDTARARLHFSEYYHDFGKISEGEKVSCIFNFQNRGAADLVLTSVTATCGCTIPEYSTKPVPPGSSGQIEVKFDATGKSGRQTKTVTVRSNAVKTVVLLQIGAEVTR